jgi:hypothetical protein
LANTNRYAICLHEAHRQDVRSARLIEELMRGGVNRFFLTRPNLAGWVSTKCIRLDRPIKHHKSDEIILKLRRLPDNTYEVLKA